MRRMQFIGLAAAAGFFASCGPTTQASGDATSQASALTTAQCSARDAHAQADACFQAFDACRTAAGANLDDCRATLRDCLPTPPQGGQGGCGGHRGPPPGPRPDLDGGQPPMGPPPMGPPPGGAPGCGCGGPNGGQPRMGPPPGGRHGPGGRGGPGGPIRPDLAEVKACHDSLVACLGAGTDELTCRQAHRQCMRDAFEAAFQAFCDGAQTQCSGTTTGPCAQITARCSEGVGGPADPNSLVCP